jgi:hypothetical protein
LLPVAVDAYAATATGVWLRDGVSTGTRSWARANALGAIAASVAGNAVYHELTAPGSARTWVVVIVAAVPPLMLGAAVHTAVLVTGDRRSVPAPPTSTVSSSVPVVSAPVSVPLAVPAAQRDDRDREGAEAVSRPADRDQPAGAGTDPGRRLELVSAKKTAAPSRGGEAERLMREHYVREQAAGRTPTGAELDRVAGTRDYGRRVLRTLRAEKQAADASVAEAGR